MWGAGPAGFAGLLRSMVVYVMQGCACVCAYVCEWQAVSKKESILDLNRYIDQGVRVKFQGGREGGCGGEERALHVHATPQPVHH